MRCCLAVQRAARIAAAAHGGQVVLSEATRQLAASQLAGEVSVSRWRLCVMPR